MGLPPFPIGLWGADYSAKVLAIAPANLISYLPLSEPSGSVAVDLSGNGRNGTYTGVGLGQPGIGDGRTCPLFDGVNDYCNWYSAGLAAAFNGNEGTLLVWLKVANVGVWTDGTIRGAARIRALSTNTIDLQRSGTNNRMNLIRIGGGTNKTSLIDGLSSVGWLPVAFTWSQSADQQIAYLAGVQQGATLTGLGVWTGALAATTTTIGATSTTPTGIWSGAVAHAAIWNVALNAAQIAALAAV